MTQHIIGTMNLGKFTLFNKVDKKIWKAQTDRVNDAIKYLKAETSKKQMISLKLQACG